MIQNTLRPEQKRKWWILGAMTTAISMVFIDVTVLPVTLPTISRELNFSDLGLQWIINAYTLALTVLVLAGGRLAQLFGLKRIFCCGTCLFAGASAMCGFGDTEGWLIMSRLIQGAGGALMLPATQAIITHSFPPHQRGKAIGTFISIGSVFLALGPLIGGYLTEFASWRYVFWINLPIATTGLILTLFIVPSFPGHKSPFDLLGVFTNLIGVSGVVIGIMQAQEWGWDSPLTLLCLGLGAALVAMMIYKERNGPSPLIDVSLIKKGVTAPLEARRFEGLLSQNPNALHALQELPSNTAVIVQSSLRDASISGFYLINSVAAAIAILGLIVALTLMKSKRDELSSN